MPWYLHFNRSAPKFNKKNSPEGKNFRHSNRLRFVDRFVDKLDFQGLPNETM